MSYKIANFPTFESIVEGKKTWYNSAMVFYSEKEGEDNFMRRLYQATSEFFSKEYNISKHTPISFSNANENYLFYLREQFEFPIHRAILRKVELTDSILYSKEFPVMSSVSKEDAVVVREDLNQVYAYFPYSWRINSDGAYAKALYEVFSNPVIDAINAIQKENIDDINEKIKNNETDMTREEFISDVITTKVRGIFHELNKYSEFEVVVKEFFK